METSNELSQSEKDDLDVATEANRPYEVGTSVRTIGSIRIFPTGSAEIVFNKAFGVHLGQDFFAERNIDPKGLNPGQRLRVTIEANYDDDGRQVSMYVSNLALA